MSLSIFLARLLGLYFIIVFVLLTTRKEEMGQGIKAFCANPGLFMFAGALDLLGGLAILIGHPVWDLEWPVVITLLGLLMVIKGIVRLGCPSLCVNCAQAMLRGSRCWSWISIITLVLGIFLLANGFHHM